MAARATLELSTIDAFLRATVSTTVSSEFEFASILHFAHLCGHALHHVFVSRTPLRGSGVDHRGSREQTIFIRGSVAVSQILHSLVKALDLEVVGSAILVITKAPLHLSESISLEADFAIVLGSEVAKFDRKGAAELHGACGKEDEHVLNGVPFFVAILGLLADSAEIIVCHLGEMSVVEMLADLVRIVREVQAVLSIEASIVSYVGDAIEIMIALKEAFVWSACSLHEQLGIGRCSPKPQAPILIEEAD